ncbi:uncharacterized protein [Amphiura filiformis]|uniref:uncharacterized protein n=1 Tax=Amphiura filiformis TaxID=82378 RepID=UPI003B20C95A
MTYVKTNPMQAVVVTVVITGDPDIPDVSQVVLVYNDKDGVYSTGTPTGNQRGFFLTLSYSLASHQARSGITCSFPAGGQTISTTITPEYYRLPSLSQAPSVEYIGTTSVTLRWDVWNADNGDTGDGPITKYNVYHHLSPVSSALPPTDPSQTHITLSIGGLIPGTLYFFHIRVERQGPGGEGPSSPRVEVITMPLMPEPGMTTPTAEKLTTMEPVQEITQPVPGAITTATVISTSMNMTEPVSKSSPAPAFQELYIVIIAVIVVLVILLILIIVVIWILRRRRSNLKKDIALDVPATVVITKKIADDDDEMPIMSSSSNRASMSSLNVIDNIAVEVEEEPSIQGAQAQPTPSPIPTESSGAGPSMVSTESIKTRLRIPAVNVKDFANYVKDKRLNFGELRREWESLPKDLVRPTGIGKKSENRGKNRFRNVVAYDHSRVVLEPLEDDPDSDYINACYIKGLSNPRAYIASQGPSDISIGDYWRMVWQENVSVMVMACNIIENGRLKCVKYWPEKGSNEVFGDFVVSFDREEQKHEDFLLRFFTITKEGEGTRNVVQLHYVNWPDKDVPKHCTPVLQFLKEVNEHYQDKKAPLLIHCSAGAGRTGALIGIHAMMEMAEHRGQVDIYNFVFSMRNNRANIVQTSEQYAYVHDAMLEHLFCKNSFVKAEEFADRLKSLQEQNPETGNTYLEDEYAILELVSPNFSSDRTRGSLKDESLSKLRSGDSIPVDSSRPYLMTSREDNDMSPYINAAFMDGYKKKDLFISTQMPLTHTVVDIWRMMYDYNCTSIVHLNAMDHEEEDCPQYWPDEGTSEYGPFSVSLMEKESTQDFKIKTLRLVYTKRDVKSPIPVRHFQYTTWPKDDERPATSEGILQLISAVEKWQKTLDPPGPIVVLCMNAAGRTGAFCTIQTCLDQVREEQGANVLQNVKQLRIHRTNMVDTPAKYLFCYETILEYLKAFDDYASKKSYQNVMDVKKDTKKPKEPKKKKKQDDAVIYGNQETIQEIKKKSETEKEKKSSKDDMPQGASNVPSKSEASKASKNEASSGVNNVSPSATAKGATLPVFSKNEGAAYRGNPSSAKTFTLPVDAATSQVSPSIIRKATLPAAYGVNDAGSKRSPSAKRKSTPPVVSKIKPAGRGRPKTYIDRGAKPLVKEGGNGGGEGVDGSKKGVKKQEQHYQNVTFDGQF